MATQHSPVHIQAFQLGWTLAEILGRVGQGLHTTQNQNKATAKLAKIYYPRLSISTGRGQSSKTEQFRIAVLRWEALAQTLGFLTRDTGVEQPLRAPIEAFKQYLNDPTVKRPPVAELQMVLQDWGLQAHARLAAQDVQLGTALIAGASLADTYWYWYPAPQATTAKKLRDQTWYELLSKERLFELRRRIESIEPLLPPYIGLVIRKHLQHWQIGRELYYDSKKVLYRRRFRGGPKWWRKRLNWKERATPATQLRHTDERDVHEALEKQTEQWADLILGWKRPEQFLGFTDYRWAEGIYFLVAAVGAVLTGVLLFLAFWGWSWMIVKLSGSTLAGVFQQGELKDQLLFISTALGWLGTLVTLGKFMVQQTARAAQAAQDWLTAQIIARRTLSAWDSRIKHKHPRKEEA